jgi:hypothetical protein
MQPQHNPFTIKDIARQVLLYCRPQDLYFKYARVCKTWLEIIKSKDFIEEHRVRIFRPIEAYECDEMRTHADYEDCVESIRNDASFGPTDLCTTCWTKLDADSLNVSTATALTSESEIEYCVLPIDILLGRDKRWMLDYVDTHRRFVSPGAAGLKYVRSECMRPIKKIKTSK